MEILAYKMLFIARIPWALLPLPFAIYFAFKSERGQRIAFWIVVFQGILLVMQVCAFIYYRYLVSTV